MDDDGFDVETGEWVGDSNRVDESDYRAFIERVRDKPKKDFLKELRRCLEGFLRPRCRPWESHEQDLVAFNYDFREGAGKLPYVVDFGEEQDDIAGAVKSLSHVDWVLKQDERSGELHFSESEYLVGRAVSQIDNLEFRKKAAELDELLLEGGRGFLPGELASELGVSTKTINTYAKIAGIPTPGRGKRNFRYSEIDRIAILAHAASNASSDLDIVAKAKIALQETETKPKNGN